MASSEEYECYECTRKYCDYAKYRIHMKMKHKSEKINIANEVQDNHFGERMADLEDKIYSFLG